MTFEISDYRIPEKIERTILGQIVHARLHEVSGSMLRWPAESIRMVLDRAPVVRSLRRALLSRTPGIIAEIKKASPSAGLIRSEFDAVDIAEQYERGGAAAISVVTETTFFQGELEVLARLRWACGVPLLRKDFILDSYQLLEARHAGADAVLLIVSLHNLSSLKRLRVETENLGMEALVEVHDEPELETALAAGATLVGVNNRNLSSLDVQLGTGLRLGPLIPKEVVAVAESGIHNAEDLRSLTDAGFRGFLIGESLMRAPSPRAELAKLILGSRRLGPVNS